MSAGPIRPDVWLGLALNADPNDENTPRVWTNVSTTGWMSTTGNERGRNYELDQPMTAEPSTLLRDVDEYLNPDNASESPYIGQVKPLREVCALAHWPAAGMAGSTGNLINAGTWQGSGIDPYDPTFESYVTGADAPNWVEYFGMPKAPTVTTTTPFQGSKAITYPTSASDINRGIRIGVPCIPGEQYTSSLYVRQSAASKQQIFIDGVTAVYDDFGRTSVNELGTPTVGAAYTESGGLASDYQVDDGQATLTLSSTTTVRYATSGTGTYFNSEQTALITLPVLAAGNGYAAGLVSRFVDTNNHYRALLVATTAGTLSLAIDRMLGGVSTVIEQVDLPLTYAAGDRFWLWFKTSGTSLVVNVWRDGAQEAALYQASALDASAALQVPAAVGLMAYRFAGNTNTSPSVAYSSYSAIGSIAGTSTTTTGAYVRLSVTYTADQVGRPAGLNVSRFGKAARGLALVLSTVGTALAGTVLVDAVQHEAAAAASAFTADGPVIYPLFRNLSERFPRTWRSSAREGFVQMPCVDALMALNRIRIGTEVDQKILSLQPDLYYTMGGGPDATASPDLSGNDGPPLTNAASPFGAGTAPSGGTAMNILGDPGGTGTAFTWVGPAGSNKQQGTIMTTPTGSVSYPPPVSGGQWAMTIAGWVNLPDTYAELTSVIATVRAATTSVLEYRALDLRVSATSVSATTRNGTASASVSTPEAIRGDGLTHFVMATIVQDATNTTLMIRVDDSETSTTISTAVLGGITPAGSASSVNVGGIFAPSLSVIANILSGSVSKLAVWGRELNTVERDSLYVAATFASDGEFAGARILRHVQNGGYTGPTRIAGETSGVALGPPTYSPDIDLLSDSLNSTTASGGNMWVAPDGVLTYETADMRWLRITPSFVFGEDADGGELPYSDGAGSDFDPMFVYPNVTVTRANGATAQGGLGPDRRAAARAYFPLPYSQTSDYYADDQAQYWADWIFYSHRDANLRWEAVQFDALGTGMDVAALWPAVLRFEPGVRVTMIKRNPQANGGTGMTMENDFFIEKVSTPELVFLQDAQAWVVAVQLSPIGLAPGEPTVQPWILGDPVYGVLDFTTVLAP